MLQITFVLRYKSYFGEDLHIKGDIPELGKDREFGEPLHYSENGWTLTIETNAKSFRYSYILTNQQGQIRQEKKLFRKFELPNRKYKKIVVFDVFEEGNPVPSPMLSKVFTESIMRHECKEIALKGRKVPMSFNVVWPNLPTNQQIAILGNSPELGNWNLEESSSMECTTFPEFCTVVDANNLFFPIEYKYILKTCGSSRIDKWEEGCNHYLPYPPVDADFIVVNDGRPRFDMGNFKGAGTAVPVFSLRSRNSFGVGEFSDLKLLADWAKATGQRIIQTLPINDTTNLHSWKDSYPYSGISVFALHPMYINLEQVGEIPDLKKYNKLKSQLNDEKFVDYEAVNNAKWEFIKKIYKRDGKQLLDSEPFKIFYQRNKHWLDAYAVFCFLRDKFKTSNFEQWGDDATFYPERIEKYCDPTGNDYKNIAIHFFVQFHLDKQLREAVAYAHSVGIALKGDIPIGVNRHSVEVWMNTRLFDCNGQAGAPPDFFSKFGQNWGFPIYNWEEMKKDGYSWWCNRLRKMADYFDAYRIDHILGFFRIFRIPADSEYGLLGQFAPALAMTKEEIKQYNIELTDDMLEPFIHDDYLEELFGKKTQYVKENFLTPTGHHRYRLKKHVDTQQKINSVIPASDLENADVRTGLKILTCQVLFVRDSNNANKFHPRISMQQSFVFKSLSTPEKTLFSKLYNDFFYVRNNDFWGKNAMEKLPALINSSNMLVCGEDLGMVPDCVHPVMDELQILSLEIQRMPKDYGLEFGNLERMPYLSVSTSSTHDMSTMRQWWEEDRETTQRYYNQVMHEYGPAPLFCEPWICQRIIESHLQSNSMWVILPLQDWIAMDGSLRNNDTFSERINDPANADNYWHYRMHICLEDLIEATPLNQKIYSLVKYYGR